MVVGQCRLFAQTCPSLPVGSGRQARHSEVQLRNSSSGTLRNLNFRQGGKARNWVLFCIERTDIFVGMWAHSFVGVCGSDDFDAFACQEWISIYIYLACQEWISIYIYIYHNIMYLYINLRRAAQNTSKFVSRWPAWSLASHEVRVAIDARLTMHVSKSRFIRGAPIISWCINTIGEVIKFYLQSIVDLVIHSNVAI